MVDLGAKTLLTFIDLSECATANFLDQLVILSNSQIHTLLKFFLDTFVNIYY